MTLLPLAHAFILYFLEEAPNLNKHLVPFKCWGFHYSMRNKRLVSNKCWGSKWACLTHCMHAEHNCKTCVQRSAIHRGINLARKCCLTFVERSSFGVPNGGRQPYRFKISVLRAQTKVIAAVVGGLLEKALKTT